MPYTDDQKKEIKDVLYHDLRYSVNSFDNLTITIGGGALALSLTFIGEIVPLKDAIQIWILYTGIAFLTIAIVASFIGHAHNVEFLYKELITVVNEQNFKLRTSPIVGFNKVIAGLVVGGVIAIVVFVVVNVTHERNLPSEKPDSKGTTKIELSDSTHIDSIRNDSSILRAKP